MGEAYNALMSWVATNGYQLNGICREVYLVSPADTTNPDEYFSELQVPVMKA
jgi:effector-binding domain-containing protein